MTEPGGWKKRLRIAGWVAIALLVLSAPWSAPLVLARLSFFRVQKVEIHGLRYLAQDELLKRVAVDTTMSVWMDLRAIERRVEDHPQLLSATVSRKLPGTIVVRVEERRPVALVPRDKGFAAVDDSGATLSVDPATGTVDVPILRTTDSTLIRLLAGVRNSNPGLYERISEIAPVGKDEIRIELLTITIRAMRDVTVQRLLDILPVERDLASKGERVSELDLRFRGQIIARKE